MYYEEQIICGSLMYRTSPNGKWLEDRTYYGLAVTALSALDDEERMKAFGRFCTECGSVNHIHCARDE